MLISPDEITKSLSNKGWIYKDKMIIKTFCFNNYMKGIAFVNKVAELADTNNHHPSIKISFEDIEISIASHNMGGVTTQCVNLANRIDLI